MGRWHLTDGGNIAQEARRLVETRAGIDALGIAVLLALRILAACTEWYTLFIYFTCLPCQARTHPAASCRSMRRRHVQNFT